MPVAADTYALQVPSGGYGRQPPAGLLWEWECHIIRLQRPQLPGPRTPGRKSSRCPEREKKRDVLARNDNLSAGSGTATSAGLSLVPYGQHVSDVGRPLN
jgi:hypothetical protein